jgi:hypothetical protein
LIVTFSRNDTLANTFPPGLATGGLQRSGEPADLLGRELLKWRRRSTHNGGSCSVQ